MFFASTAFDLSYILLVRGARPIVCLVKITSYTLSFPSWSQPALIKDSSIDSLPTDYALWGVVSILPPVDYLRCAMCLLVKAARLNRLAHKHGIVIFVPVL